jgi:hypothetical protein
MKIIFFILDYAFLKNQIKFFEFLKISLIIDRKRN